MDVAIQKEEGFLLWQSIAVPEVHQWQLMKNPYEAFTILCVYLLLVSYILPNYMKNRKPFVLKDIIIGYNFGHVLFSIFLVYKALSAGIPFYDLLSPVCKHRVNGDHQQKLAVASTIWWYLFAKFLELPDTIFFILRKKFNQVSFLHVYHHATTFYYTWIILKVAPEENSLTVIGLNSFIHIFMYLYYALSVMGPEYRKYLWWKKYMTTLQIIQFLILTSFLILGAFSNCNYHKAVHTLLFVNTCFILYLFSVFYKKTYTAKKLK